MASLSRTHDARSPNAYLGLEVLMNEHPQLADYDAFA